MIDRPCSRAKATSSGSRAIVPSSLTTSQMPAAGVSPASRARSTPASVWPGRTSTPPSTARSGKTWPGRVKSPAVVAGSPSSRTVSARSTAEMPVLSTSRASTETVYAVPLRSSLTRVIGGRLSRSASAPVIGTQITPEL